jgi:TolB-like protein
VVSESIAGRNHLIKEYTIGTEVLGRDGQFMAHSDASVRIHAVRLRKVLDEYYQSAGAQAKIRIEIPKGSYRPVFSYISSKEVSNGSPNGDEVIPEDSICIVPFSGFINNDSFNFSTIGFCEYLSEKLSLFQDISVFSLQSVDRFIQEGGRVHDLGEKFGVTYYLTGSMEMDEFNILVSVQLFDAMSNTFIWSHDFRAEIRQNSLMDIVEDITSKIVSSLAGYSGYIHYKMFNPGVSLPVMSNKVANAVFWFYRYQAQHSEQVFFEAIKHLEQAIKEEPECSLCYAVLGHLYADGIFYNYETVPDPISKAWKYVSMSLSLDANCQHAYVAKGWLEILNGDKGAAVESIERFYSINPNSSFFASVCSLGWCLVGEYDRSISLQEKAIHLSPLPYWWMSLPKVLLALKKGNYQEALFHAQKKGTPKMIYEYVLEMIACFYLNDMNSLEKYVSLHRQKFPGSLEYVSKALPMITFDQEVKVLVTRAFEFIGENYLNKEVKPV